MQKEPLISVVIPALNEKAYLGKCLGSVINQNFDMAKVEIIVVDNGSEDKTREVAQKYKVKIVSEPKRGLRFARQAGLLAARGKIVACTDADTILPKNWLAKVYTYLSCKENVAYCPSFRFINEKGEVTFPALSYFLIDLIKKVLFVLNKPVISSWGYAVKRIPFLSAGGYNLDMDLCEDLRTGTKLKRLGKCIFDTSTATLTSTRRVERESAKGNLIPMIYDTLDDLVRVVILEKLPSLTRKHYH